LARSGHERVLVDANVLLSYLLKPTSDAPPARLIRLAFLRRFQLLVAAESLTEVRDKVVLKPYLADRISQADLDDVIASVTRLGEVLPVLTSEVPLVARDRKDDYLLAQADRGNADVLVTGDEDLLTLGMFKGIWILSPADFIVEVDTARDR
jgi:putative PIN family toxin of toxin-antitoxin system